MSRARTLLIEYRWAENQPDQLSALAADLVGRRVAVIVAFGIISALPAQAAATTTPVVFYTGADPVASGLVTSLNRPGGNLTGSALLAVDLMPKRLQLLGELIPDAARFGVLSSNISAQLQAAARTLGVQILHLSADTDSQIEMAFATFLQQRARGVVVSNGPFYDRRMDQLAPLAASHAKIAPGLKRAAIIFNPDTAPVSVYMSSFETAARSLKIVPIAAAVHDDKEIEKAIIALRREARGGLVVMPDTFTVVHRVPIISAAARNNVPAVYPRSDHAPDGRLLSYGVDQVDIFRRAALMSIAFSGARRPANYRFSIRPSSSWSSTSRPPRRSTLSFRRTCSPSPTR